MLEDGRSLDEFGVDRFVGDAVLVDVRGRDTVRPEAVRDAGVEDAGMALFRTGHAEAYGEDGYYDDHPVVAEETARALVEAGVGVVGLDTPSPDAPPDRVHDTLLSNDVLLLENLVNLGALADDRFRCHALPLDVANSDAAPCRVVAVMG
jgi:kynurenine formamidase